MTEDASKLDFCGHPPSDLLKAVRGLHDLSFRLRYRADVFLHSLSLFKKIIRASGNPMSSLHQAASFYLSAKILETRQATPAELVTYSMYAFTRD